MRLTSDELRVISFLLRNESEHLSQWHSKIYHQAEFKAALEALADKIKRVRYTRKNVGPLDVNDAINSMIEAHKKKQLVLSTPESVDPETN